MIKHIHTVIQLLIPCKVNQLCCQCSIIGGVVILCTDTHLGFTAAVIRTDQADIQCDILTDLLWQIGAAVPDFLIQRESEQRGILRLSAGFL